MNDMIERLARLNGSLADKFGDALQRLDAADRQRKEALADLRDAIGHGLSLIDDLIERD